MCSSPADPRGSFPKGWIRTSQNLAGSKRRSTRRIVVDKSKLIRPPTGWTATKTVWRSKSSGDNKDPFYDRDLNNFRLFLSICARSMPGVSSLVAPSCSKSSKCQLGRGAFGNSTTHMAKLLPRLDGGSGGGCPVVVSESEGPVMSKTSMGMPDRRRPALAIKPGRHHPPAPAVGNPPGRLQGKRWIAGSSAATTSVRMEWLTVGSSGGPAALCKCPPLRHHPRRPAVAVHQPDRQDRARASAAVALRHHDARRDLCAAGRALAAPTAHLYLWCPNALLPDGLARDEGVGLQATSPTSSGTRCARTAAPTGAASASTSAT